MPFGETTARSGLGRRWNQFLYLKATTESMGQGKVSSLECLDRFVEVIFNRFVTSKNDHDQDYEPNDIARPDSK